MSRKVFIGANWKMNLTLQEAKSLYDSFLDLPFPKNKVELVVFPPQPFLSALPKNPNVTLAAQNFHAPEFSGAFTGETSLAQLESMHISTVLVGHSERRGHFGETDSSVMLKALTAVRAGFRVVLCCGEPKEIRDLGKQEAENYVSNQLAALKGWSKQELSNLVIAYEPIWAIGTGLIPTLDDIRSMHMNIKQLVQHEHEIVSIPIVYGGSCDAENSRAILSLEGVDGGLIGGASLKLDSLQKIIENAC